jgi:hypothetical protein
MAGINRSVLVSIPVSERIILAVFVEKCTHREA